MELILTLMRDGSPERATRGPWGSGHMSDCSFIVTLGGRERPRAAAVSSSDHRRPANTF
jgi:hypothetical protein